MEGLLNPTLEFPIEDDWLILEGLFEDEAAASLALVSSANGLV